MFSFQGPSFLPPFLPTYHPSTAPIGSFRSSRETSLVAECYRHSHTVGVLGGSSTATTVEFLRRLVAATADQLQIPLIMCSDPDTDSATRSIEVEADWEDSTAARFPNHRATHLLRAEVHDRVAAAEEPVPWVPQIHEVEEKGFEGGLFQRRRFLERAGAKLIVMPCQVSHAWYKELASDGCVPFLNMADCVAMELEAENLRPLESGSRPKVGILSTQAIIAAGFYQQALSNQGFDVVLPDKATMEHTVIPGIHALKRQDMEGARNLLRIAVQVLLVSAVNVVVLACDNVCTAFPPDDPLLERCIDPVDSLVRATVEWARTAKCNSKQGLIL